MICFGAAQAPWLLYLSVLYYLSLRDPATVFAFRLLARPSHGVRIISLGATNPKVWFISPDAAHSRCLLYFS